VDTRSIRAREKKVRGVPTPLLWRHSLSCLENPRHRWIIRAARRFHRERLISFRGCVPSWRWRRAEGSRGAHVAHFERQLHSMYIWQVHHSGCLWFVRPFDESGAIAFRTVTFAEFLLVTFYMSKL
jgi:hypothetical protein